MRLFLIFISGMIFGAGLSMSGMTNPEKVQNFLSISQSWDPSLIFVMIGAIIVAATGFQIAKLKQKPIYSASFPNLNANKTIDFRLIIGSIIFGIGWGLSGYCPGPAVANIATMKTEVLVFLCSLLLGSNITRILTSKFNK